MSTPARVFLIDGSSQMYRAYHAMRGGGLTGPGWQVDPRGLHLRDDAAQAHRRSCAAVHRRVVRSRRARRSAPRWPPTTRRTARPCRRTSPSRFPGSTKRARPSACPILTFERFEADDVIGTLAEKAVAAGFEVAIVTGDKDFFQLVHDGITVYNPKEDGTWFDADGVKEKFGVAPAQVVDVLALMGDSIDNIKGVPGIGEKGARDLIATYGSVEELLAHASEVSNKRYREGLLNHAEDARQSRELARIRTDVPVPFEPDALRYRGASRERCFELFSRLGFRSLVLEYAPTADTIGKDYATVESLDDLRVLAAELKGAGRFGLRVLSDSPAAMRGGIVGLSFSTAAAARPLRADGRAPAGRGPVLGARARARRRRPAGRRSRRRPRRVLRPILEDDAIRKVGHDLKFDAIVLAPPRRHAARLRHRRDDRQLSRSTPTSRTRSRIWRSSTSATRRSAKKTSAAAAPRPSRSPTSPSTARSTTPANAPTSRCSCRRRCRRAAEERRPAAGVRRARAAAHPRARRHRARRRADRRRGARRAGGAARSGALAAGRDASTSSRAKSSTSTRPRSCRRSSSTAWACAPRRSGGRRRPRRSQRRSKCSRSWRSRTSCPSSSSNGAACRSSRAPTSTRCPRS